MGEMSDKLMGERPNKSVKRVAGVPVRDPFPSENTFFKKHPHVAGMAASDNKIILNSFSNLNDGERDAVLINEAARVHMRTNKSLSPQFELTDEQLGNLQGTTYSKATLQDRRETIAARIISGDPSGGTPTREQSDFVERLRQRMFPKPKLGKTMNE